MVGGAKQRNETMKKAKTIRILTNSEITKSSCLPSREYEVNVEPFFDADHREVNSNRFMLSIHVDDFTEI